MANDSGLNPVTPNLSVRSCTAVPITPCSRPSPPVSHATGWHAAGTLAWRWPWGCFMLGALSPRPPFALAGTSSTCAGPDPPSPSSVRGWDFRKSHLGIQEPGGPVVTCAGMAKQPGAGCLLAAGSVHLPAPPPALLLAALLSLLPT